MTLQHVNAKTSELLKRFADDLVVVNNINDFPKAIGGIILLEKNRSYLIASPVSTANRFTLNETNVITSVNPFVDVLTFTGTGAMFTGINANPIFNFAGLNCPTGTMLVCEDTVGGGGTNFVRIFNSFLQSCFQIADITSMRGITIDGFQVNDILVQGVRWFGTNWGEQSARDMRIILSFGTAFDFGTAVFTSLSFENYTISTSTGSGVGMSGATGSANMVADSIARVRGYTFRGSGTDLSGIDNSDIRWEFQDCNTIVNSVKAANTSLGTTSTTSALQNVFSSIGTTSWTSTVAERFTTSTAGVITYIGEGDGRFALVAKTTQQSGGGGQIGTASRIAVKGTTLAESESITESNRATATAPSALFLLSTNDTIEIFVANLDNNDGVTVAAASLFIIGQ